MYKKVVGVLVLLLCISFLFTACGGVETGSDEGTESIPTEGKGEEQAEQNQGETESVTYLLENNVFTFAMSGEYHPFNYVDEASGELTGFDVEIGKAIAEYHGWEANPVATPWSGILSGLRSSQFDAIIGSMGITMERAEQVDFSHPYYLSGAQLFVKKGSSIEGAKDLSDEIRIGVALGTSYEPVAREYSKQVATYESDVTALRDLATSNNLDAVITDRLVGLIAIDETGFELEMAGDLIFEEEVAIPVQKGNQELLDKINEALAAIRENGTYEEISKRYFGVDILE
ncbi:transporter substrate-binding domain-containing protein [Caldalkalibacillus mannanilyticus]|uniref:transporter substrate-binding domain-containing protein n=1 Tax=Caldalkalibacillus mannanilyticus TaxID=1418 RepID=UPI00046A5903|nr:transporter substrate-binding domain-containing protein [Caldalkalibacillus mannanilyticus]